MAQASVFTLGLLGDVESRGTLIKILNQSEKYFYLQASAAESLSRIGDEADADIIFRAYQSENNPILARQLLLALCRVWCVEGKSEVYTLFDVELKATGKGIEMQLKQFCNHPQFSKVATAEIQFSSLMQMFDNNELDKLLNSIVKAVMLLNLSKPQLKQIELLEKLGSCLNLSDDEEQTRMTFFTILIGYRNLLQQLS